MLAILLKTNKKPTGNSMERHQRDRGPTGDTPREGPGRPYLNEATAVDRLIRDFTRAVLDSVGRHDFMAYLEFECRRMNNLFLGITPTEEYQRGSWNAPDKMGQYVQHSFVIDGETRHAVRDAFMLYFSHVFELVDKDHDFDAAALEPLIARLRNALLGQSDGPHRWIQ